MEMDTRTGPAGESQDAVAIPGIEACNKILIIKSSSMGDICNALPVADVIRRNRPDADIGWVVKSPFRSLIDANPNVNTVWPFARKSLMQAIKVGFALRKHKYQVALDLQSLFVSGLISKLSGARFRIAYDTKKEGSHYFNNFPVVAAKGRKRRAVDLMLDFPKLLGIKDSVFRPQEWLASAKSHEAQALLTIVQRPYAVLFVGANTPQRMWSQERWGQLADRISENGLTPIFVGAPQDHAATVSARSEMKNLSYSVVGRTDLLTLAAIIGGAKVVVGGDSGPLHMAVAAGTPVVGVYGPTDPGITGPYGGLAKTVYVKQFCSPCYRRPTCGGAYFCMAAVETEMMLKAIKDLVGNLAN
jgi:heptosyltransferase-1